MTPATRAIFLVLCCILLAGGSLASVVGTAHDTELAVAGSTCSACHIPHQAAGEKFWA